MANRSEIRTKIQRELRDPNGKSWTEEELNDLINSGINAVSDVSPRELREDVTYTFPNTESVGNLGKLKEVTLSNNFHNVFRVTLMDTTSIAKMDLLPSIGGTSSGWEFWNGKVQLPESMMYQSTRVRGVFTDGIFAETVEPAAGDFYEQIMVRVYGYGHHMPLEDDETESTMSEHEEQACRIYAVAEALSRLMTDRANFQQWQVASGSSDISISELAVLSNSARQRWIAERQRLRKMRRLA